MNITTPKHRGYDPKFGLAHSTVDIPSTIFGWRQSRCFLKGIVASFEQPYSNQALILAQIFIRLVHFAPSLDPTELNFLALFTTPNSHAMSRFGQSCNGFTSKSWMEIIWAQMHDDLDISPSPSPPPSPTAPPSAVPSQSWADIEE